MFDIKMIVELLSKESIKFLSDKLNISNDTVQIVNELKIDVDGSEYDETNIIKWFEYIETVLNCFNDHFYKKEIEVYDRLEKNIKNLSQKNDAFCNEDIYKLVTIYRDFNFLVNVGLNKNGDNSLSLFSYELDFAPIEIMQNSDEFLNSVNDIISNYVEDYKCKEKENCTSFLPLSTASLLLSSLGGLGLITSGVIIYKAAMYDKNNSELILQKCKSKKEMKVEYYEHLISGGYKFTLLMHCVRNDILNFSEENINNYYKSFESTNIDFIEPDEVPLVISEPQISNELKIQARGKKNAITIIKRQMQRKFNRNNSSHTPESLSPSHPIQL